MHLLLGRVEWKSTNWWPASWTAPLALGGSLATAELLLSGAGIPSLLVVPRGPRPSAQSGAARPVPPLGGPVLHSHSEGFGLVTRMLSCCMLPARMPGVPSL